MYNFQMYYSLVQGTYYEVKTLYNVGGRFKTSFFIMDYISTLFNNLK